MLMRFACLFIITAGNNRDSDNDTSNVDVNIESQLLDQTIDESSPAENEV